MATYPVRVSPLPAKKAVPETDSLLQPEDGDLWQPLPPPLPPVPSPPLWEHLTAPADVQEDKRWDEISRSLGFERIDTIVPDGFEHLSWDAILPSDRESLAKTLEPYVARGEHPEHILPSLYSSLF